MTSRELKKLKHYPEFRIDAGINEIIDFIIHVGFTEGLNTRQGRIYNAKFGEGSDFVVCKTFLLTQLFHVAVIHHYPEKTLNGSGIYIAITRFANQRIFIA